MPETPHFPEYNPLQEIATTTEAKAELYHIQQFIQNGTLPADPAGAELLNDLRVITANFEPESEARQAAARSIAEQGTAPREGLAEGFQNHLIMSHVRSGALNL